MNNNPLLKRTDLPLFSHIQAKHIEPAIEHILTYNRAEIDKLLQQETFTWDTLITPLQQLEDMFARAWSPVRHLNSVNSQDDWRKAHDNCLEKISEYYTELGQNETLFRAYESLTKHSEYEHYTGAQKKLLELALRDFKLSGVALPDEDKQRFKDIQQQLSQLHSKFENNILDATDAWNIHLTNEDDIAGIPEHAVATAKKLAQSNNKSGWIFNLEFPSYLAVITYADSPELRETIYHAYTARASDQGPNASKWDNSNIIEDILRLRHEEAGLLGFENFSELSLAPKMAKDPKEVLDFLNKLAQRSKDYSKKEYSQLCDFAKEHCHLFEIQPWDIPYVSEKLRQHRYAISKEMLRPYFPETNVIKGLFAVTERLFGIKFEEIDEFDTWHKDVKLFEVYDENDLLRGKVFMDLYARPGKRGGAWMDQCHSRFKKPEGSINIPVAFLTCNFASASSGKQALLAHDEVITLFHEFGHVLHGILTKVDYADIAGTSNVAWDAVELPSQFLENWCWDKEALSLISGHYETANPIPDDLFEKMIAAKNFQSAMQMVRQLEFGIFDFRMHTEYNLNHGARVQEILDEVRADVAAYQVPASNRFQHSFSHIFAGGYAAGYYSYKWAEVLSADAFSKFEERGIFDHATGRSFLHNILEVGGSKDAADAFRAFRGREPNIDALLRHSGLN